MRDWSNEGGLWTLIRVLPLAIIFILFPLSQGKLQFLWLLRFCHVAFAFSNGWKIGAFSSRDYRLSPSEQTSFCIRAYIIDQN
jgi:hypothetical protein